MIPLVVLLALGRASGLSTASSPRSGAARHAWGCKNGNLLRNGVSAFKAPKDLSKPIWSFAVPGGTLWSGHIEATPLIDSESNVYIGTTTGGIYALRRDGSLRWDHQEGRFTRVLTGALDGTRYYVATNAGTLLAIDLRTGGIEWRTQYAPQAGWDAWAVTAVNGTLLVGGDDGPSLGLSGNNHIVALDTADGSVRWKFRPQRNVYNFMPVAVGGKILFMDSEGGLYKIGLGDGTLDYRTEGTPGSFTTAGLAVGPGGLVYMNPNKKNGTGLLQAREIATGKLRWSQDFDIESSAAPAVGPLGKDGTVGVLVGLGHNVGNWKPYKQDAKAVLRAFHADTGKPMWSFNTPSRRLLGSSGWTSVPLEDSVPDTWSTPAIDSDGTVYVGWEGGDFYAVDGANGKIISKFTSTYGEQGEPAIGEHMVVFPALSKLVAYAQA